MHAAPVVSFAHTAMQPPDTFTAADLLDNPSVLAAHDPPVRLGVFGDPVAHSKSPAFHNAALEAAGIRARYAKFHIPPDRVADCLRALPAAGLIGANITVPHKAAALATVDEADPFARACGSVNTVLVEGSRLRGFNTDGPGFKRAVREEFGVDLRDLRVAIIGAGGGAGRAAAVQCAHEPCERLVLANRSLDKARSLAASLTPLFRSERLAGPSERLAAVELGGTQLRRELDDIDLVVNATPLGMKRSDPLLLDPSWIAPSMLVLDMVYGDGDTRLLEDARAAGARCANGLGMLLHQGALAFEIWFDRDAPLATMRRALEAAA